MRFQARIYDPRRAATIDREIDASDEAEATTLAEAAGCVALAIQPYRVGAAGLKLRWNRRARFDVRLFCEEVRTLLSAGMSLVETLDTLAAKSDDLAASEVLRDVRLRLLEGKSFSAALESHTNTFPLILTAAVNASERTGRVQDALEEYLRYDSVLRDLKRKILNAAIYPCLVILFGIAVGLFLLGYVVPRFAKVYDDFAQNLSVPTRVLIEVGRFFGNHSALLIGAFAAVIAALWWLASQGRLAKMLLWIADRIGPVQRTLRIFQLSRVFQTMAMLIRGGYPVVEAAGLARSLAFQPPLRRSIDEARRSIAEGKSFSAGFSMAGLTDSVSERLLKVGERTGRIDPVLEVIAKRYTQELETFIERLTRVIEPALMMTVGLLIGALIVLMYMPIFDLANGMQ
jgi:general secretion pathway protein F